MEVAIVIGVVMLCVLAIGGLMGAMGSVPTSGPDGKCEICRRWACDKHCPNHGECR